MDAKTLDEAKAAAFKLKAMSKPFLNWSGKAERLSFDVPTLPLFVHERLSTKAILETIRGHKTDKQMSFDDLFGDPRHSIADQVLKAYEHKDKWVNRMILGDSLIAMNSLLHYEGLGGQVQMIYMDPPYGVKFGSNFQPFVRKREVKHGEDDDMTREPEMVQAYRDTWELGTHSYLAYLRDRFLLSRDLLAPTGSLFVQISDENVHHVREILDEVFGAENFCGQIAYKTTGALSRDLLESVCDYVLWYAKDRESVKYKYRQLFEYKEIDDLTTTGLPWMTMDKGQARSLTDEEMRSPKEREGMEVFLSQPLTSQHYSETRSVGYKFKGETFYPSKDRQWSVSSDGLDRLVAAGRVIKHGSTIRYKAYLKDYPVVPLKNVWEDTPLGGYRQERAYVVQTPPKVISRCILMTTDPGDLVIDPTCGSGATAYWAEHWGRRWITMDTSRVPLALARQRLLTATFPFHQLNDDGRGPASGFVYKRRQNRKGEDIGGIVPHISLKSIANSEQSEEVVLVDRPEKVDGVVRVSGPFSVEATIPAPISTDGQDDRKDEQSENHGSFVDRMLEVLRKSPVLHLDGKKAIVLKDLRLPAKTLSLSAEAVVINGKDKPVALLFGPENGAVSERAVQHAAKEANLKGYAALYVLAFAIQPNARQFIEQCEHVAGISAFYIQATPDLMMGDLLKNMRSSQIFSVCGLPEIKVTSKKDNKDIRYQVELLGLDVFDPISMEVVHRNGNDVPAWFLDTNYNDLSFHVSQAFFPRTSAWDNLRRSLKGDYEDKVWDHLAGTESAPFDAGDHQQIAVKVIDDRGNELLVVKSLKSLR
jgi:adenine-specific DNA-methyltransferase